MQAYVDAGLTTFDMADIYGPAEEIFGQFNSQVQTHTQHSGLSLTHKCNLQPEFQRNRTNKSLDSSQLIFQN